MSGMEAEKLDYHTLLDGDIPPWVMRFIKTTGKAVREYDMIKDGDDVVIAVSGGKDSMALSLALAIRLRWLPISYKLHALMIEWEEYPLQEEDRRRIQDYYDALGIDLTIVREPQHNEGFKGEFNCYLCARNRRRIFFNFLRDHGWHLIAEGHHLDDLVETTLMNLAFRGRFETMSPVQDFFGGKISVLRPMIEVHESATRRLAETYDIPVVKACCPRDQTNIRSSLKPIIGSLVKMDRLTREHVYAAHGYPPKKERSE